MWMACAQRYRCYTIKWIMRFCHGRHANPPFIGISMQLSLNQWEASELKLITQWQLIRRAVGSVYADPLRWERAGYNYGCRWSEQKTRLYFLSSFLMQIPLIGVWVSFKTEVVENVKHQPVLYATPMTISRIPWRPVSRRGCIWQSPGKPTTIRRLLTCLPVLRLERKPAYKLDLKQQRQHW